jgi:hypothetical protein
MAEIPDDKHPPPLSETDQEPPISDQEAAPDALPLTDTPMSIPSPNPPGSSASGPGSIAESVETVTPTLGGSVQTQVNVVNRGFTPRPSTADKPNSHQFYANLPVKRHGATDIDNESLISRSTAQRTNFSSTMGGSRRPPSRSHIPAIMPAYSFYHPLRPPAVANASGQQQIPQTKPIEELEARPTTSSPTTSQQADEISSVHGKPSKEPLLPKPAAVRQEPRALHPVFETASNRTSMRSTKLLGTNTPVAPPVAFQPSQEKKEVPQPPKQTRNWQHFPGQTRYHLHGRIQFGTQYWANIGTAVLIFIPTGLYFAFTYFLPQNSVLINMIVVAICGPSTPQRYLLHSPTSHYYVSPPS